MCHSTSLEACAVRFHMIPYKTMTMQAFRRNQSVVMSQAVAELSDMGCHKNLFHLHRHASPLPSSRSVAEIIDLLRQIIFPGYFGQSELNTHTLSLHLALHVDQLYALLMEQIAAGLCFEATEGASCTGYAITLEEERAIQARAEQIAAEFVAKLPELRTKLAKDVEASYNADPAATSYGEIIACYPTIRAVTNYRAAHLLLQLGVPLIPRMMSEMAHRETGIDIHPAAQIGEYFNIDHGTGVVIGATCIIGNHVQLFQGVTLGAKSFPLDEHGNPIKHIPRHPILEDGVIVYSNATILGRITVGKGAVIGGNVWITQDVSPGGKRSQNHSPKVQSLDPFDCAML